MARNDGVAVPANVWTQLTGGDASAVTVENPTSLDVQLLATAGASQPEESQASLDASRRLPAGAILLADVSLAQLFPGVAGANRLWALAPRAMTLRVSHA